MRLILILVGLLCLGAPVTARAETPSSERIEIPVTQTRFPGGVVRYSIKVGIDGAAPIDVMLDTGSSGLHLLPGAQPHAPPRGRPSHASYGSGVELIGQIAPTDLSLDGRMTIRADVDWTQKIECVEDRPRCPAKDVPLNAYRIGGGARDGYQAILGVGLRRGAADNPLTQVATGAWIVELPAPDDPTPGKLILNATPADRARFPLLIKLQPQNTNGGAFWLDNMVPTCLSRADDAQPICATTMLDSGSSNVRLITDLKTNPPPWPAGTQAVLAYGPPEKPVLKQAFIVGHGPGTRVEFGKRLKTMSWSGLNAGLLPFLGLNVFYDARNGFIGLAPKAASVPP